MFISLQTIPAVNQLEAFLRELAARVRSDRLAESTVAPLRELVREAIKLTSS